jgi:hypothetical protein
MADKIIDMDCDLQGCGCDTCYSCVRMAKLAEEEKLQLDLFENPELSPEVEELVDKLDAYLTAIGWLAEPSVIMLFSPPEKEGELERPLLRIKSDMSLEYGPTYKPDEAAEEFWRTVEVEGRTLAERLLDAVSIAEEHMERAERSSSCYIIADAERDALRQENAELRRKLKAAGLK